MGRKKGAQLPPQPIHGDQVSAIDATEAVQSSDLVDVPPGVPRNEPTVQAEGSPPITGLKSDSEIGPTQRARRAKKAKEEAESKAYKEARDRRIKELETNGVDRAGGRCERCEKRDIPRCLVFRDDYHPMTKHPRRRCTTCFENRVDCKNTVNEAGGACDQCYEDGITCIDRPPRENKLSSEPKHPPCLGCLKSGQRCLTPPTEDSRVATSGSKTRDPKPRGVFPVHTIHWLNVLRLGDRKKYISEQIQVDGTPRPNGPCTRCVYLGIPCRTVKEGTHIWTLTQPTRCASCILSNSAGPDELSRSCDTDTTISHDEHELSLDPRDFVRVPRIWDAFGEIQQPTSYRTDSPLAVGKSAYEYLSSQMASVAIVSYAEPDILMRHQKTLLENPLEPSKVACDIQVLDSLVNQLAIRLVWYSHRSTPVLPFSAENVALLEDIPFLGDHRYSTTSFLRQLLRVSPSSELKTAVHRLHVEHLSYETVFRAVVAASLVELVFSDTPFERLALERTLQRGFSSGPGHLDRVIEDYFSQVVSVPSIRHTIQSTARGVMEQLIQTIQPLISLLSTETDEIKGRCRRELLTIVEKACILNADMKFRPSSPVEVFYPYCGDYLDRYYVEGNEKTDNKIEIMVMFGVKASQLPGYESDPVIYAKARAVSSDSSA